MIGRLSFAAVAGAAATFVSFALVAALNEERSHPSPPVRPAPLTVVPVAPVAPEPPRPPAAPVSSPVDDAPDAPAGAPLPSQLAAPAASPASLAALGELPALPSLRIHTGAATDRSAPLPPRTAPGARARRPKLRRRAAARYPDWARRQGVEGFVRLRLQVDPSGRVTDVLVVEATPPGVFENSAREAARGYRFEMPPGTTQTVVLEQRMEFRLR